MSLLTALLAPLTGTPPATPDVAPTPVHERCVAVTAIPYEAGFLSYPDRPKNEQLIAVIDNQIHGETAQASLAVDTVYAVKSDDFPSDAFKSSAWFVAGQIVGPDFAEQGATGVWITNIISDEGSIDDGGGLMFSVNLVAITYSNLLDGTRTAAQFSMEDDGAQAAFDCAKGKTGD